MPGREGLTQTSGGWQGMEELGASTQVAGLAISTPSGSRETATVSLRSLVAWSVFLTITMAGLSFGASWGGPARSALQISVLLLVSAAPLGLLRQQAGEDTRPLGLRGCGPAEWSVPSTRRAAGFRPARIKAKATTGSHGVTPIPSSGGR